MNRPFLWRSFAAVAGTAGLLIWFFLYRDTSVYAPGFSEEAFACVRAGMTMKEVTDLLGQPLSVAEDYSPETWTYASGSKEIGPSDEFVQVVFSASGQVTNVTGPPAARVRHGMSRAQVAALLGAPTLKSGPRSKVMYYSRPSNYGVYRARIVELDETSRVTNLTSYEIMD